VIVIETLLPDSVMQDWLADEAAAFPQLRLRRTDVASAGRNAAGLRAAILHGNVASSEVVTRYAAAGVQIIVLAAKGGANGPTYQAIEAGATYVFHIAMDEAGLRGAMKRAAGLLLQGDGRSFGEAPPDKRPRRERTGSATLPPLVAIGASAGGPRALAQVLAALPENLPAAVVVVVHVETGQDAGLREFLASRCRLPIDMATQGASLQMSRIVLAPAGHHLQLDAEGRTQLLSRDAGELFCPSVDRVFTSLAQFPEQGVAALLTGMGTDGARGLLAMRRAGWFTMAQDAGSSAVYGMPREAADLGAAGALVPLQDIASVLGAKLLHLQLGARSSSTHRPSGFAPLSKPEGGT
jgi:two-component system, chemotaxis family, response regulator WspF